MGETIEFPNKEERLFYLAKKYFSQNEWMQSLKYFEEYYDINQTVDVNTYLVRIAIQLDMLEEGYTYVQEFHSEYQTNPKLQDVYFELLLKRKQFLTIEKWLLKIKSSKQNDKFYMETLQKTQEYWTKVDNKDYGNKLDLCENLLTQGMTGQLQLLKDCEFLTKEDFIRLVTKNWVNNPDLSVLVRAQLIDSLVELGGVSELHIRDVFGVEHVIDLSRVPRLMPSVLSHPIYIALSEYLSNNSPTQEDMVLGVVKTHLGMMYPCIDVIIEKEDDWKEAYLRYFGFEMASDDCLHSQIQKIDSMIKKLDTIMMNTMTK